MNALERRENLRQQLVNALAQENPYLRHVSIRHPASETHWGSEATEIEVNGQTPNLLVLRVRTIAGDSVAAGKLRSHGLEDIPDDDDPAYTIFVAEMERASADELVTFVEWVYLVVMNAPDDYEPTIKTPVLDRKKSGSDSGARPGCMGGCRRVAFILLIIFFAMVILRSLLAH
jgi:hypothetical protein